MSILSDADLIFLGRALAERNEFYLSLPQHKKAAQLTFINIILAFIERNQLYYTTCFMTKLESMINYQDMFTVVFLTFLKDTLAKNTADFGVTHFAKVSTCFFEIGSSIGLS